MVFAYQSPETSIVMGGEKAVCKDSISMGMLLHIQAETANIRNATRVNPNNSFKLRGRRSTLILLYEAIQAASQPTATIVPIESKVKAAISKSPGISDFTVAILRTELLCLKAQYRR
jgi:hypothetical protein